MFGRLGVDGAVGQVDGDYLAVVNQNASGSKIDRFLKRSTTYEAEFDPTTSIVSAIAEVTLENRAPATGLPDYVIRPHPNAGTDPPPGTNRTYMSLYTPLGLEELTVNGVPVQASGERELRRNVFSIFYNLPPESVTVVRYRLRGSITPGDYRLHVRSQVLASEPEQLSVRIRGASGWRATASGQLLQRNGAAVADTPLTKDFRAALSFSLSRA